MPKELLIKRTPMVGFRGEYRPRRKEETERTIAEIDGAEFDGLELDEFCACIDVIEHRDPLVFITGPAGTGKSTLVRYIQYHFGYAAPPEKRRNVAVVAPTAVAAISAKGQTIHSLFGFPPKPPDSFIDKIRRKWRLRDFFQKLEILVIDEISMVRADMIDAIDKGLRINTGNDKLFGGVQIVMVGDLLQLPPIVGTDAERRLFPPEPNAPYGSRFFPGAYCLEDCAPNTIFLHRVFRQKDLEFVKLLHNVRMEVDLPKTLSLLNEKCFRPKPDGWHGVTLVTINKMADDINKDELEKIAFPARMYAGIIKGRLKFNSRLPAPNPLTLKVGAQVMLVKNDPRKRWVNGTLGEVVTLSEESIRVRSFDGRDEFEVERMKWDIYDHTYDNEAQRIVSKIIGSYRQFPMTLAWAATIHKTQGATLDSVFLDLTHEPFAYGHTYVALSRCRSMDGLYLLCPLHSGDIITEPAVLKWYREMQED